MKNKKNQKIISIPDIFEGIVKNAIDYLEHALNEFETKPKYSLINFITALELFIKARLLKEHWTLLLDNPDKSNLQNFINGESFTISFEKAINRISNVLGLSLTNKESKCFDNLRKHRNKLIHFFNKEYAGKSEKVKSRVLSELSEGWFYLHRLLTQNWKDEFVDFSKNIETINYTIDKKKLLWRGKYEAIKDDIEKQKRQGVVFQECFICGFKTSELIENDAPLYDGTCLICNTSTRWIKAKCPKIDCGEIIYVNSDFSTCYRCKTLITIENLRDQYEPHRSPKELMCDNYNIHCPECMGVPCTVIEFKEKYLCLSCLTLYDNTSECDWCNTRFAGQIRDDSFWLGCEFCEGHAGWHADKD